MNKQRVKINIEDLKPHPKNPKKHNENFVAKSIEEIGYLSEIVCDENNVILAGHGRLKALKRLNKREIDVLKVEGLTEEQKEKFLLADNQATLLEGFDDDKLKDFDDEVLEWNELKVDKNESAKPKEDHYNIPEEIKTDIKVGDLFEIKGDGLTHRLLCGDATKKEDVERLMDGKKADMVFTDPPYGVDYTSRVDESRRKNWGNIKNDNLKGDELRAFLLSSLEQFECSMYVCCNWQSVVDFIISIGKPNAFIIWDKQSIGLGVGYRNQHEIILFYGKLEHNSESNVWKEKRDVTSNYSHPTQKPVAIPARAIKNSSKGSQIVLDLFGGSGSTLIASHQLKRNCYMMELEPKYCQVILDRIKNLDDNVEITKL